MKRPEKSNYQYLQGKHIEIAYSIDLEKYADHLEKQHKIYQANDYELEGDNFSLRVKIEKLEKQNLSLIEQIESDKWISVEDRLPEDKEDVIIYFTYTVNNEIKKYIDASLFLNGKFLDNEWKTIPAEYWKPLPKPPKN